MAFDFSLLKNIDFTKPENIIFLFIVLVIALIIFFVFAVIVNKIIKSIKRIIFGDDTRKRCKARASSVQEKNVVAKSRIVIPGGSFAQKFSAPKPAVEEKDVIKIDKKKSAEKVEEGLSALKADTSAGGLQSRMPSREEQTPGEREIKIPRTKRFFGPAGEGAQDSYERATESDVNSKHFAEEASRSKESKNTDSSMLFRGKKDVNRRKLEYEMRYNPKIWKAAKDSMLYLNRGERAKLIKEVFPSAYGRNISKTDLHQGIKKLDRKMRAAKTPKDHERIRKQIKFFKKIGGIR